MNTLLDREAIADALHDAGDPCLGGCLRKADALLARGAVNSATLAAEVAVMIRGRALE